MENFKILGQAISNGTAQVELYAVPVTSASSAGSSVTFTRSYDPPTQTLVTSIIVCNQKASAHDFNLSLFDSASGETGGTPAAKNFLLRKVSLAASETKVLSLGLTMSARSNSATPASVAKGDILQFSLEAAGADVSVTAMGIEIT